MFCVWTNLLAANVMNENEIDFACDELNGVMIRIGLVPVPEKRRLTF